MNEYETKNAAPTLRAKHRWFEVESDVSGRYFLSLYLVPLHPYRLTSGGPKMCAHPNLNYLRSVHLLGRSIDVSIGHSHSRLFSTKSLAAKSLLFPCPKRSTNVSLNG